MACLLRLFRPELLLLQTQQYRFRCLITRRDTFLGLSRLLPRGIRVDRHGAGWVKTRKTGLYKTTENAIGWSEPQWCYDTAFTKSVSALPYMGRALLVDDMVPSFATVAYKKSTPVSRPLAVAAGSVCERDGFLAHLNLALTRLHSACAGLNRR